MKVSDACPRSVGGQRLESAVDYVAKLRKAIPEAFSGGEIDFVTLRRLLGASGETGGGSYGLVWHGKREARGTARTPAFGTLLPCPELSVDWERTGNLLVEGDNLEALKLLRKSHSGKVRLIYIDPPYNTGRDFVYRDCFRDSVGRYLRMTGQDAERSGRLHTGWLNMMYPRLELARTFLSGDGVIFISIDDGEVGNLRLVCDEIFGEGNFVANVVLQKKYTRANDARWFSDSHDHILVYARRKEALKLSGQPRSPAQLKAYSNPDSHPKGPWKATPLHAKSGRNTEPFTFRNGVVWAPPKGTYRRFSDASMRHMDGMDEIWFGRDGKQVPQRKTFLSEARERVTPTTLWLHQEAGHNHEANSDLKALGLGGVFDNPKPVRLVRRMLDLATDADAGHIVMDFFAGSGTTAQAVIDANEADGGNRRFVCIQAPEPIEPARCAGGMAFSNISDFAAERIARAGRASAAASLRDGLDRGFRRLKLVPDTAAETGSASISGPSGAAETQALQEQRHDRLSTATGALRGQEPGHGRP